MKACTADGCPRGDGIQWPNGPVLCQHHRQYWAADHLEWLTAAEVKQWTEINRYVDPDTGESISNWPDNWKTPVVDYARLAASNKKHEDQWKAEREAKAKERASKGGYAIDYGQTRWGKR